MKKMDARYQHQDGPWFAALSPSQQFALKGYWRASACAGAFRGLIGGFNLYAMRKGYFEFYPSNVLCDIRLDHGP